MFPPSPIAPRFTAILLALAFLPVISVAEPELLPPVRFTQPSNEPIPDTAPASAPTTPAAVSASPAKPAPAMIQLTGEGIAGKVWVDFEPKGELPLRWEPSARESQLVRIVGADYNSVAFRIPATTGPVEVRLERDPIKRFQVKVWLNNQAAELIASKPPRPLQQVPPAMPMELRRLGKGGKVTVQFTITPEGRVASPVILASTHEKLSQSTLAAVAQWRFQPAELEGRPVETVAAIEIPFAVQK
jgi:protein TonB